jgi:sugar/nucleoside kinase (ribokinase family)
MNASPILVVGSVALDSVETPFGKAEETLGGSASYFALSARFFAPVCLVAVVGEDFESRHLSLLRAPEIDLGGLEVGSGKTFRWTGEYGYDLNEAHTLATCLNVFESFRPKIPDRFRQAEYVFLANIDPVLQREVLEQMDRPRLVVCDTMNFWIRGRREELLKTIRKVDILILNHAEVRELAGEANVLKAARAILEMGPHTVVVKKGEHGAFLFSKDLFFSAPAYPMELLYDPTGAGDTFAGGFVGYLAMVGDHGPDRLRRAVVWGTVMASFAVEKFGVTGLCRATHELIRERFSHLREISQFDPD